MSLSLYMQNYQEKYLQYKTKYLNLKKQLADNAYQERLENNKSGIKNALGGSAEDLIIDAYKPITVEKQLNCLQISQRGGAKSGKTYEIKKGEFVKENALYPLYAQMEDYRLGDMIKSKSWRAWEEVLQWHLDTYPESIVAKYFKYTKTYVNIPVLAKVSLSYLSTPPASDTLVIHLRVGDTLEKNLKEYIYPLKYYETIKKMLKNIKEVHKIIIVGGAHVKYKKYEKSSKYINKVVNIFNKDYPVSIKVGYNPDEDFAFLANSHWFTPSKGGYSRLAAMVVYFQKKNLVMVNKKKYILLMNQFLDKKNKQSLKEFGISNKTLPKVN